METLRKTRKKRNKYSKKRRKKVHGNTNRNKEKLT